MENNSYLERRQQLETYFDRTAMEAWTKLTSNAPVSKIRATVRRGRDETRETLLSWLPKNLDGMHVLDAGCGTGALSIAMAERGAQVLAIDLSEQLLQTARERLPANLKTKITFVTGDMLDLGTERFEYVVAMDSLIHYSLADYCRVVETWSKHIDHAMLGTFAPKTPALAAMHMFGKLLPAADRAPAIVPIAPKQLLRSLSDNPLLKEWRAEPTHRVSSAFYKSESLKLTRR